MLDKAHLSWYNDLMTTTQIPHRNTNIDNRAGDEAIDVIGDFIEDTIADVNKDTQLYILKYLEDVVANLIFDRTPQ